MAGGLFSPCVESVKQPFQSDALQALRFFVRMVYSFFGFLSMRGALVMMLSPKRFFSASIAP